MANDAAHQRVWSLVEPHADRTAYRNRTVARSERPLQRGCARLVGGLVLLPWRLLRRAAHPRRPRERMRHGASGCRKHARPGPLAESRAVAAQPRLGTAD